MSVLVFAQTEDGPEPTRIGVDSAQQKLVEVSVDKFEDAGFWSVAMPIDSGIITYKRLAGGPAGKTPIEEEEQLGITETDQFVIGVKTQFFQRAMSTFTIKPARPIPIPGITKTISLWVAGRNTPHELRIIVEDQFGGQANLRVDDLNFSGWKRLNVAIPPSMRQQDYHYSNKLGIKIIGLVIETDLMETYGSYYIYFDDMRAVTDLFPEASRDEDDMVDSW
jgi:hypothetical protein